MVTVAKGFASSASTDLRTGLAVSGLTALMPSLSEFATIISMVLALVLIYTNWRKHKREEKLFKKKMEGIGEG